MAKDILIVPGSSNIQFSGSAVNDIKLETQDNGSVAFTSTSGSLFTITNSLTGSLFSVGDVTGVPILDVNSDDTVTLGQFSSPLKIYTNTSSHTIISGSSTSTGSFGKVVGSVDIPAGRSLRTSKIRGRSPISVDTDNTKLNMTGSFEMKASSGDAIFDIKGDASNLQDFRIVSPAGSNRVDFVLPEQSASGIITITSGQNVGIGDTTPSYKLDIAGDIRSTGAAYFNNYVRTDQIRPTGTSGIEISNSQGNIVSYIAPRGSGAAASGIRITDNFNMMFGSDNDYSIAYNSTRDTLEFVNGVDFAATRMAINSSGNVGIGRIPVNYPLEVDGHVELKNNGRVFLETGGAIADNGSNSWLMIPKDGANLQQFYTAGTSAMSINSSQNVTMTGNLTVAGNITAQEFITELNTTTVIATSGSTKFGNSLDDTHQITGSLYVSSSAGIEVTSASPILRLNDNNVSGLYHRIIGGGNAGLEIGADLGNVLSTAYIRFDVGNSEKVRITEKGNVGIGTASPSTGNGRQWLSVRSGSQHGFDYITFGNQNNLVNNKVSKLRITNNAIGYGDSGQTGIGFSPYFDKDYASVDFYWDSPTGITGGYLAFKTTKNGGSSLNTHMTITPSGSVGIGTTNPGDYRLYLNHNSEDVLKLYNTTDGQDALISFQNPGGTLGRIQGIDNGGLAFDTGNNAGGMNSNAMFISNAANVGIGATSPGAKLEVKQTAASTGLLINQDGNSQALTIDSEATTQNSIWFQAPATTTANYISLYDANSLTTGRIAYLSSNSANTSTRSLVIIINDNSAATGATPLHVQQDSSAYAMFIQNPTNTTNHGNGLFIAGVDENTTSYPLFIKTNSSTLAEDAGNVRFVVRADGKVGIKTASPSQELDVNGNIITDGVYLVDTNTRITQTGGNAARVQTNSGFFDFGPMNSTYCHLYTDRSGFFLDSSIYGAITLHLGGYGTEKINMSYDSNYGKIYSSGGVPLSLGSNGDNNKLVIATSGNVGIGTTSPNTQLAVSAGTSGDGAGIISIQGHRTSNAPYAKLSFWHGTDEDTAYIMGERANNSDTSADITFNTSNAGTAVERMVITYDGKVGINQVSPGAVLEVKGHSSVSTTALITHGVVQFKTTENDSSELRHQFHMGGASDGATYDMYDGAGNVDGRLSIDGDSWLGLNGDVGIGTTTVDSPLHVYGGTANTAKFQSNSGATNLIFEDSSANMVGQLEFTTGTSQLVTRNSSTLKLGSNNVGTIYITDADNVGIGTNSPNAKLEVATSTGTYSHFGAIATTSGHYTGISFGYKENNLNYRKAAIVQEQTGDGSARGNMHFLVDTVSDGNSASIADSKMMIHGISGKVGIGNVAPSETLTVTGGGSFTTSVYFNGRVRINHDGQIHWGAAYNQGYMSWTTNEAIFGGLASNALRIQSGGSTAAIMDTSQNTRFYGNVSISNTDYLQFLDSGGNAHFQMFQSGGDIFEITSNAYGGAVFTIDATGGGVNIPTNLDVGAGLDVTGNITVSGTVDGVDVAALSTAVSGKVSTTGTETIAGVKTFSSNLTVGTGQIVTPSSTNLQLNPNTGLVSVGGVIQTSGAGNNTMAGNLVVGGNITAQQFITEYTTDTVIATSGSTNFGNSSDDRHDFSGSLAVSGSGGLTVTSAPSNNHLKLVSAGTGGNVAIKFDVEQTATNYVDWQIGAQGIAANAFTIGHSTGNGNLTFDAGNTDITILSSGNVGIGNTNPNQKLKVSAGHISIDDDYRLVWGGNTGSSIAGSTANDYLRFYTDGTERVRVNNTGVGIGTTAPDVKFHVMAGSAGSVDSYLGCHFTLESSGNTAMQFLTTENSDTRIWFGDAANTTAGGILYTHNASAAAEKMELRVNASTRLKILGSGYVGIGPNITPSFPLSVGSITNDSRVEIGTSGNTTWQSNVYSVLTVGVSGSHAITQDGSANSQQWFNIYDTGTKYRAHAGYGGNWMFTASTGTLAFRNTDTTSTAGSQITDLTAKFAIDKIGRVGIGTDTPVEAITIRGTSNGTDGFHYPAIAGYTTTTKLWALEQHFGDEGRLALYHGGNLKVLMRASGSSYINSGTTMNFGVGTASPAYKLDVTGTGRFTGNIRAESTSGNNVFNSSILIAAGKHLFLDGGSNTYITEGAADNIYFYTGGTEKFRIDNAGNAIIRTNNTFLYGLTSGAATVALIGVKSDNWMQLGHAGYGFVWANGAGSIDGAGNTYFTKYVSLTGGDGTLNGNGANLGGSLDLNMGSQASGKGSRINLNSGHATGEFVIQARGSTGYSTGNIGIYRRNGAATYKDLMTIQGNGLVGIGTESPTAGRHLEVHSGDDTYIQISTSNAGADTWLKFRNNADNDSNTDYRMGRSNTGTFIVGDGDGDTHMAITSTGNVGIGKINPSNPLEVAIGAGDESATFSCFSTTDGHFPAILFAKSSNATIGTYSATAADESLGAIWAQGVNTGGTRKAAAGIKFEADAAPDGDSVPGRIRFLTSDLDDAGSVTERMRIDDAGNVGINRTNPGYKFEVGGVILATGDIHSHEQIYAGNGTDGTPSFAMLNDPNTGWRSDLSDNMRLITGGTARAVLNSTGFGIGTTNPLGKLVVNGGETSAWFNRTGASGGDHNIMLNTDEVPTNRQQILFNAQTNGINGGYGENSGTTYASISTTITAGTLVPIKGKMEFKTSGGDANAIRMTIDDTGYVGIGTGDPAAKLHVNSDISLGADANNRTLLGYSSNTFSIGTRQSSTNYLDTVSMTSGKVGIGTTSPGSTLHVHKASGPTYLRVSDESAANGIELGYENGGTTNASIYNRYSSNAASAISFGFGTPSSGNVVATMLQGGKVGILDTTPSYQLDVTGTIRATADVIAYSDERVKDNIETIENPLDKIKELRGVSYNRNDIEDKSKKIGVIAQEVEKVLPEVVEQDDAGKYSVAYGNMVGLLIESMKEQQKQIEELQSEIKELKDGSSK